MMQNRVLPDFLGVARLILVVDASLEGKCLVPLFSCEISYVAIKGCWWCLARHHVPLVIWVLAALFDELAVFL